MNPTGMKVKWALCRAVVIVAVGGAVSCLRETTLDVAVAFDYTIEGDHSTAPLAITITNSTSGADTFEWTFEGGEPASSDKKDPGRVVFTEPGEHTITLTARNHDRQDSREVVVMVDPAIEADFGWRVLVNDFAPAQIEIENLTRDAVGYEWTFEGGEPASSTLADPGVVLFREAGEHRITLKAHNGSETFTAEKIVTVVPPLECDFTITPLIAGEDMEAPFTAVVKNTSRSSLSVHWQCPEGIIADRCAAQTTIRFDEPGTYTITLTADNLKERKSLQKQITVAPSSGIFTIPDLRFGISQAKNTIGCLFSAERRSVLKSKEVTSSEIGRSIELGFFALSSSFDHCRFFSPDKARTQGFPAIPGAMATQVNNRSGNNMTRETFDAIATPADLNAYSFAPDAGTGPGDQGDAFPLDELPRFSFFVTADGRRGIVMIREAVRAGKDSYAVAAVKIEKRKR